ncbi:hypothetical protein AB395_00001250 [Sinorhizobium fredii CCBAU 45436]|nr:hypothetical protein SF83666_c12210 [Sinorhizobium fredii CCBAU 83666]AWI56918.1 hypothetical protein AB395_00001250 [Sinorhizobium fredii CCBAU 45436]AWM24723.1 hypothetical protein AOX55_00001456 [Sinorhizobium fredii CCBAU 25509]
METHRTRHGWGQGKIQRRGVKLLDARIWRFFIQKWTISSRICLKFWRIFSFSHRKSENQQHHLTLMDFEHEIDCTHARRVAEAARADRTHGADGNLRTTEKVQKNGKKNSDSSFWRCCHGDWRACGIGCYP